MEYKALNAQQMYVLKNTYPGIADSTRRWKPEAVLGDVPPPKYERSRHAYLTGSTAARFRERFTAAQNACIFTVIRAAWEKDGSAVALFGTLGDDYEVILLGEFARGKSIPSYRGRLSILQLHYRQFWPWQILLLLMTGASLLASFPLIHVMFTHPSYSMFTKENSAIALVLLASVIGCVRRLRLYALLAAPAKPPHIPSLT